MTFSKLGSNFNPSPEVVLGRKMSRVALQKSTGVVFHLQQRRNLTSGGSDIVC